MRSVSLPAFDPLLGRSLPRSLARSLARHTHPLQLILRDRTEVIRLVLVHIVRATEPRRMLLPHAPRVVARGEKMPRFRCHLVYKSAELDLPATRVSTDSPVPWEEMGGARYRNRGGAIACQTSTLGSNTLLQYSFE
jgi:hypothetical protein